LEHLSAWLDLCDSSVRWVRWARNRIVQVRETFGSLGNFEAILGQLEAYGQQRVKPSGPTTYQQDPNDIRQDCTERLMGVDIDRAAAEGFYPQLLRSGLISAFREYFYDVEEKRTGRNAYDDFAERKANADSITITFNYDIALERALAKAGKWDAGNGYGFPWLLPERVPSTMTLFKLHSSVNWFKEPTNNLPPPVIFKRDLALLGYEHIADPRLGGNGMGVDNCSTFILPDPNKKFDWEPFWKPLWKDAAKGLPESSEVFIHGYSMPPSDELARRLLFDNISKSATINIHCRKRGDDIADELRRCWGVTDVRSFPAVDFEAWVVS
jgi:hypothetical protein